MDNLKLENSMVVDIVTAATGPQHVESTPFVLVPPGYNVHDLSNLMDAPAKKKGVATMTDAASFIAYFNRHKIAEVSSIYAITGDNPSFVGLIDDDSKEDAAWRQFRVNYKCPLSKEWLIWTGKEKKPMTQLDFAEFLEENYVDINSQNADDPSAADMLEVANTFKVQKKVNFSSGQLLSNGQVDFKYQEEVSGQAGAQGTVQVPERFYIAIPVFDGDAPYRIEAKLRWRLNEGKLSIWYDLVRRHKIIEHALREMTTSIASETATEILRGSPP